MKRALPYPIDLLPPHYPTSNKCNLIIRFALRLRKKGVALHLCNDAREQKENEMTYTIDDYLDSLHCDLDGCYRDLAYYESIGHQSRIDEVERVIASIKKQIEEAA